MEKRFIKIAIVYSLIAMAVGVFYREFTKFQDFDGLTALSVVHTHYFMLGMFFFLILSVLEHSFKFSGEKGAFKSTVVYQIGLNLTGVMLLIRGVSDVIMPEISSAMDASISGVSGIGHILLGVSLILILIKVYKSIRP